ncbi:WD40 repeat domain-containing protein [Kitasatospora sp. NPDC090308]|uniref:WD40 repeat domain-containing protein n=1 Tax=Kitasatospora sp. NPDC090308 TaxID=3364082 RepID=UPI00381AFBC6
MPDSAIDLAASVRTALQDIGRSEFNVVIDALDEAASPKEVRAIVKQIIRPLVESCADLGVRVIVGTRRQDNSGSILTSFEPAARVIDLDESRFFKADDLTAYALASLQLSGDERNDSPYADTRSAEPVARRIAELSGRNFLVAGLAARTHGLHDLNPVMPKEVDFPKTVDEALRSYLELLPNDGEVDVILALTVLAYADPPGFTLDLWRDAIIAVSGSAPSRESIRAFTHSSAANFLVEENLGDSGKSTFRLFHQALNDALRNRDSQEVRIQYESSISRSFVAIGRSAGWENAPEYILRSLPRHAAAGHVIDDLLSDADYLLYADLRRLIAAADAAVTPLGRQRARLLRKTSKIIGTDAAVRVARLSVTEAQEKLGSVYSRMARETPYRAAWAAVAPRAEDVVLEGHAGRVRDICKFEGSGSFLVSVSDDRTIRLWDPVTAENIETLAEHSSGVASVCTMNIDGAPSIVAASNESICIWNPSTSERRNIWQAQNGAPTAVCSVRIDGLDFIASARYETVQIWDPRAEIATMIIEPTDGFVHSILFIESEERTWLAIAGSRNILIWDLLHNRTVYSFRGYAGRLTDMCYISDPSGDFLAASGIGETIIGSFTDDAPLKIWDLATGGSIMVAQAAQEVIYALCPIDIGSRRLLAAATHGDVIIYDPVTMNISARQWKAGPQVRSMCQVDINGKSLVALAINNTISLWDPLAATPSDQSTEYAEEIYEVHTVSAGGKSVIAGLASAGITVWDSSSGVALNAHQDESSPARTACPVKVNDEVALATLHFNRTLQIWDPVRGWAWRNYICDYRGLPVMCSFSIGERSAIAIGGKGKILIIDALSGYVIVHLDAHENDITAVCSAISQGAAALVSASSADIRLWDLSDIWQPKLRRLMPGGARRLVGMQIPGSDDVIVSASFSAVRTWNSRSGDMLREYDVGHDISAICSAEYRGRSVIAVASQDRTVRLLDGELLTIVLEIPVQNMALALTSADGKLIIGLSDGVLAIDLY